MKFFSGNLCRGAMVAFIVLGIGVLSANAQDAAATFKSKCAMCHGTDGKGTSVGKSMGVHDFTSAAVQGESDADLTQAITKGRGKMPAYEGKLSDAQIKDMVGYVRSLGKGK